MKQRRRKNGGKTEAHRAREGTLAARKDKAAWNFLTLTGRARGLTAEDELG